MRALAARGTAAVAAGTSALLLVIPAHEVRAPTPVRTAGTVGPTAPAISPGADWVRAGEVSMQDVLRRMRRSRPASRFVEREPLRAAMLARGARDPRLTARHLLAGRGWADQWPCLDALWSRESRWDPTNENPHSSAYGIAQFLDATWTRVGIPKTSDPDEQVRAGLRYIGMRYGSPCAAWRFARHHNYY